LERCARQGNKRFEGVSFCYLALIRSLRREIKEAEAAARRAIEVLEDYPACRAYAIAVLASMLLMQRQPASALVYAQEALSLMEKLGGVEEGESLIRVTYALALRGNGNGPEGRAQLEEARVRLLERADRIGDPHWRQSFLEGVADNARVVHLAE